jgi:hypothetical protein
MLRNTKTIENDVIDHEVWSKIRGKGKIILFI